MTGGRTGALAASLGVCEKLEDLPSKGTEAIVTVSREVGAYRLLYVVTTARICDQTR